MDHEPLQAGIGFGEIIMTILSLAFAAWSAAIHGARKDLKEIRTEFSHSLTKLTDEIAHLRQELTHIGNRLTRVETEQAHFHPPSSRDPHRP